MPFAVHSSPMPDSWRRHASWLRAACVFISGGIAIYSLAVWSYGNWHLASIALESVPIAPSTAILLLLLTLAVALDQLWPARIVVRLFQAAVAGLTIVVSLAEFIEYLIGKDAPWDVLLARTHATIRGIPVGHMSPFTAAAFLLAAFTLVTTAWIPPGRRALQRAGKIAALLGAGFGAVTVLAYGAGTPLFYGGGTVPMALLTAVAFVALNLALLLAGRAPTTAHDFLFGRPARATLPGISAREKATIAALSAALLVTVGAASVWWLRLEQADKRAHIHRELTAIAELKVSQISAWRDEQLRDAKVLMRTPYLARSLSALAASPDDPTLRYDLIAWLEEMNRSQEYAAAALFDGRGNPLLVVPASANISGPRLAAMLHELPAARTVQEGSLGRSATGTIHMDWLVPIFSGTEPAPVGAILLRVDPEKILYPLLAGWPVPSESAETVLLRRDGQEIVFLNRLRHDPDAVLTRRSMDDARLLATKVAGGEGLAINEGIDYRGVAVVGASRTVPGTPWFVIAKVDQAEAYAPLRTEAWRVGAMTVSRLTFVALCAALLWRYRNNEILRREFTNEKEREALARRLALVMEQANDAILLMDESGKILEANDRALTTYGYTLDALRALPPGGLNPPGRAGDFAADLEYYTAPAGALFEAVHQRKDGSVFPVEVSGRTFESDGRRFKLGVFRDISERKASQQHITRLSQLYAALSQINQAIVHGGTRDELFGRICRILVEPGQFKMAWIGWNDFATHQIVPVASYGDAGGYLRDLLIYSDARPEAHGPTGTALREGRTYVCQSFAADANAALWRERAARHGFLASIALPIRTGGKVVGVLTVYSGQRNAFMPGEVALLEEAAADVSFALGNLERDAQRQRAETALRESEARYRALFARLRRFVDSNIVGVAIAGPDGRVIDANDYYLKLIGFSREEFEQGKVDWRAVTPPEWLATDEQAIRELRARGTCTPYEKEYLRRDGTRVPVFLADAFLPGPTEEIAVFALDLTARKADERRLREQAEVLDKANDAIVITDLVNRITFWNHGAERLLGSTASEMVGRPIEHVFISGEGVERGAVAAAFADFVDWRGELRAAKRGGGSLEIETSLTVLRDESGQPIGRLSISTDITEKKALAEQFLRAQRVENIGMLAAGISHDLNNVLAPIGMATHLLRQSATGEGDLHLLDTLDKCADRGARLVRQILGFARGVGGEVRLIQVKHLLHDVAEVIAETFPKSIALDENIPNDLWLIEANPTQVHQVLLNLCVNARDAMPAGGTLRLRAENQVLDQRAATGIEGATPGSWLVLEVADTGTGIPEESLAQIWQPFFTTKSATNGTGLGLSTVRGIVETHRGFVAVESKLGVGTVFRVYLPAAQSEDSIEAGAVVPSGAQGHDELILLVDDEVLICETASRILTYAGYRVVTAADGVEAAALFGARSSEFALVLTDRDMPGLDGAGLAQQIRARQPAIKILAMSGFTSVQADENEKRQAIGDAFLAKPFTVETLLESVAQLLHPTLNVA
jgi:two-component system, cell cycle sensor histidine kinase and response regulator CckA